jgi:hypothetical protein
LLSRWFFFALGHPAVNGKAAVISFSLKKKTGGIPYYKKNDVTIDSQHHIVVLIPPGSQVPENDFLPSPL